MQTWLADHLIAAGHMTESGLTRRARIRTCKCRARILAGLDNDQCAIEAKVDPAPLSTLGEALALLEGRHTWALHREAGKWVLDPRDSYAIAGRPAGTRTREDVLREHRCGSRDLAPAETAASMFPETRPKPPANADPDF